MLNIINKYLNKELEYGKIDCNLVWLEIFENEIYQKLYGKYHDEASGFILAKEISGYNNIQELVDDKEEYKITNKNLSSIGSFFIEKDKPAHVAVCLGRTTLAYHDNQFRLIKTIYFTQNDNFIMYTKGE